MKILFTKTSIEKEVSEILGTEFDCSFQDFIRIDALKITPFPLDNFTLIFTSANAVKSFFENGFQPLQNKIFVVGEKTKEAVSRFGFKTEYTFKNIHFLADFLNSNCQKESLLHFCGNLSLDILENAFAESKTSYRKITVYETKLLQPKLSENYEALVFFSPSGVRSFAALYSLEGKKLFSIGKTTETELKKFTENKIYTSEENSLQDLIQIIKQVAKS